jgi:hypothetical protein
MFNLAVDRKLRGCDVVAIKVEDVAASGYTGDRAAVRHWPIYVPAAAILKEFRTLNNLGPAANLPAPISFGLFSSIDYLECRSPPRS